MTTPKAARAPALERAKAPDRRPDGRFLPGHKIHGGRPFGSVRPRERVRSLLGRELLEALARGDETIQSAFERWKSLLKSPDERIRLEAERFLFEVTNGRAATTLQIAGPGGSGELILRWQEARPGGVTSPDRPPTPARLTEAALLVDGTLTEPK